MSIFKSFISAISLYSKIPMPSIDFREGDDRFALCFFPVVGVVICVLWAFLGSVNAFFTINRTALACLYMLIAVIITGGIHIDGFMDVMDAIHSYGDHEKRLAILKDPHIGAFCVIKLLELTGVWLVTLILLKDALIILSGLGFIMARCFSGIALLTLKGAKKDGMLVFEKNHASRKICLACLVIWVAIVTIFAAYMYGIVAIVLLAVSTVCLVYYRFKSMKDFGGITGDTEGCFLVMLETSWIITVAIWGFFV